MDRRERKTKESIKNALATLIIDKGFENLTIGEVMAKADLNRSTFYLHFSTLSEVLYSMEDDLISGLFEITKKRQYSLRDLILDVAGFAEQNSVPLKAIFRSSPTHFSWKVELVFTPVIAASPFSFGKAKSQGFDYVASFIIEGGMGVFQKWIEGGCQPSKTELLKSFEGFFSVNF
jgi:AcrR family transcriptional regulator